MGTLALLKVCEIAVDLAKCPKNIHFTFEAASCDSGAAYQLFRRQSEAAIRHHYQNVDVLTVEDDQFATTVTKTNTKGNKRPSYTKVLINFMYDRFWYCPQTLKMSGSQPVK
ncbi:hypothetical protein HDV05_004455 [Chytridiales sp. JEL 0842]|nr:hypothetical protein HDV05_004455 [Chytridiales sp. JEL 0842]